MSMKNFLGSIIKKQIAIDVSNSGLLINNELLLEFSVSRLTEALGKPRITAITDEDSPYSAMYLWDSLGIYYGGLYHCWKISFVLYLQRTKYGFVWS